VLINLKHTSLVLPYQSLTIQIEKSCVKVSAAANSGKSVTISETHLNFPLKISHIPRISGKIIAIPGVRDYFGYAKA
jgi:hypothetical protein